MKAELIVQEGSADLLLFFNGWGMDRRVADYLVSEWADWPGYEIVHLYDYRDLTLPGWLLEKMNRARTIDLMAWSLGVWAAARAGFGKIDRAVAINGTLFPVDSGRGIAPEIFRGTVEHWNDDNRKRFERRMFAAVSPSVTDLVRSARSSGDQQEELRSIEDQATSRSAAPEASWRYSKAFAGGRDLVYSPENQCRAWAEEVPVTLVSGMPHFPFSHIRTWKEFFE
ncbi:MAG: DUF452 family protein [Chlorobiaceae bacterium]|nr:DUF452 family protein [Chlorobiaceae bacterium]